MSKVWTITFALLRQNRWLFLLMAVWPWAFLALIYFPQGDVTLDDLRALLQQEYFYGIALTMVYAASMLGGELRAHRVAAVLCRAVSRRQYFASLYMGALLPGVFFDLSVLLSLWLAAVGPGLSARTLFPTVVDLFAIEVWVTACGIFFSLFLPALMASLAAGAVAAALVYVGELQHWARVGLGIGTLVQVGLQGGANMKDADTEWAAIGSVLAQTGALALLGLKLFKRKDLTSPED